MYQLDASDHLSRNGLTAEGFQAELMGRSDFWFHRFEFKDGVSTPGRDPSAQKLHALELPDRLDGLTVIDIGACEGYFSFQAEARGAARVVASDKYLWTWPSAKFLSNFRYMKKVLNSGVEERIVAVEDLSPDGVGTFDIALFLGVLYHAPNMILYLEKLRSVTKKMAVVETLVDMLDVDAPVAAFYPPNSVNNDSSNWWGPNLACVDEMLKRAGFARTRFVSMWEINTLDLQRGQGSYDNRVRSGRAVWHAFV